jgi:CBS domain-containing protein
MNPDATVREIMDREFLGVSESDDLVDTVELLLREDKETAVVLRGSEHVGVLTERDVLTLLVEGPDPEGATVADAMDESVPTVSPEETVSAAADVLSTRPTRRLVVTNGNEPLGIVTEQDILAGQTYQSEPTEAATVTAEAGGPAVRTTAEESGGFEDQGICEACGTLTRDLTAFNGQLLCAECRDM